MTPKIIARVDAWADRNIAWIDTDQRRQCLLLVWKNLTNEAATSSYPYCDALRQAASGIMLALVSEACPELHIDLWHDTDLGEALVTALEAAP